MKKLIALIVAFISINAFAQKPPTPQMPSIAGSSEILKTDKRLADFSISKSKFNVYLGYQLPNKMRRQKKGDTLEMYKITRDKLKFSQLEIVKFATREGKIIEEGGYSITRDTLTVTQNSYDYIGAYAITTKYLTDKYGLKKVSEDMKAIKSEKFTERHLKSPEMKSPSKPKN